MNIRVLIAEDDPELRAVFRAQVETIPGFEVVGHAVDEERAVGLCEELEPGILLIGLDENRHISEAIAQARETCPQVKVLVVTSPAVDGVEPAGADAVLARPVGTDAFVTSLLELAELAETG